jgi:dTDP-4-dehydrorhamnose reductase
MKVLVTGVGGQLGHDVMNELARRGHQGVGSDIAPVYSGIADGSAVTGMPYVAMDITNEQQVRQVMDQVRPDAVIHCAAWTAVDLAEDADKQPKVRAINVDGTAHLAAACKAQDCKMMYISTDYVFNGQGQTPWQPDCKDYQPLNYYGETKLGGELSVSSRLEKYFIVRIAWVFGLNGKNFIKTMLQLGKTHDKLRVVCDQVGTPTYAGDLALGIFSIIESGLYKGNEGIYHFTDEGVCSWYDFAVEIAAAAGHTRCRIEPCRTEEYPTRAVRPAYSVLDRSKLKHTFGIEIPHWRESMLYCLRQIGQTEPELL